MYYYCRLRIAAFVEMNFEIINNCCFMWLAQHIDLAEHPHKDN